LVLDANGHCGLKTISLRPWAIMGEGDRNFFGLINESGHTFNTENNAGFIYHRNLAHWEILAEKALEERPQVASGNFYLVAECQGEKVTKRELNLWAAKVLKKEIQPIPLFVIWTLCKVMPWIDWLACGRLKGDVFNLNDGVLKYSISNVTFDISKGVQDLGYSPKYSKDDIALNVSRYYNVS